MVNFKHISHPFLVFLLLNLNMYFFTGFADLFPDSFGKCDKIAFA